MATGEFEDPMAGKGEPRAGRAAAIVGFERLCGGNPKLARRILSQALPHLEGNDDKRWRGRTYANLAEAYLAVGRDEEALDALIRASRNLRGARSSGEALLVLARLGALLHANGQPDEALRRLRAAAGGAARHGMLEAGAFRTQLALAEAACGHLEVALGLLRRATRDARRAGLDRDEAYALMGVASAATELGLDDEVRESLKLGLVLARREGTPMLSGVGLTLVVISRVLRDKPKAADMALQAAESTLMRAALQTAPVGPEARALDLISTAVGAITEDLRSGRLEDDIWRGHAAAARPVLALLQLPPVLLRPDMAGSDEEMLLASTSGPHEVV